MPILVSGSLVYDHIMDFPDRFKNHILPDSIHILNVCFNVERIKKSKGGTAGNIAYNLNLLGENAVIFSSVGRDGDEYIEYFQEMGVGTQKISKDEKLFTASCYITTDLDDNQITAFYNGALSSAPGIELQKKEKKPAWAIVAPTDKDVMIRHMGQCATSGIKTIFDPGQQIPAFSTQELKDSIARSNVLVGNDYEMKMIRKRVGWSEKDILKRVEILVTTYGERGSRIDTRDGQEILVEACRVKKVEDPTGAGDAFRAGLLTGLEKGYNLRTCSRLGSVAASFAIEKYGTQEHRFSKKEFGERYKQFYKEEVNL